MIGNAGERYREIECKGKKGKAERLVFVIENYVLMGDCERPSVRRQERRSEWKKN